MIQQTSLIAYQDVQTSLERLQSILYRVLAKQGEATNLQLSIMTSIPINVVTPRILELRQKDLVIKSREAIDPNTNRQAIFWRINNARM